MAIRPAQVTVSTTAAELTVSDTDGRSDSAIIFTAPAAADLFVGDATVTASTGFKVPAGTTVSADLQAGERLYGILASGTGTAYVLNSGV